MDLLEKGLNMNQIIIGHARFTCLSSSLIRMEYAKDKTFEDRMSLRLQKSNNMKSFKIIKQLDTLHTLKTSDLTIEYNNDGLPFHENNLKVFSNSVQWQPGQVDQLNLGGVHLAMDCIQNGMIPNSVHPATTAYHQNDAQFHLWRYLYGDSDVVDPDVHYDEENLSLEQLLTLKPLETLSPELQKLIKERQSYPPGLLSENGYFLYNDSATPVYDNHWPVERSDANLDYYIFVYNKNYEKALMDYRLLFGATPMIPKYTLGLWFSRYPTRNQTELIKLVETFKEKDLPLDIMVLDLEWHKRGWYGFDWNHDDFPTPEKYIKFLKDKHIYTTLNVHPDGIPTSDTGFHEFQSRTDIKHETVEEHYLLDFYNQDEAYAFMDIFHQPQYDKGVEFWWIDGSSNASLKTLGNQFFTNEIYMNHSKKQKNKRPFICSRSAGLGSHRYPVHFTGDTYSHFSVLKSQVEYTLRAGHIGQSFITHDIGGHMWPYKHINPELLCRWYQFGGMSPIFRLHSSGGSERLPWLYDEIVESSLKQVMNFRMTLLPYLYNLVKESHDTCLPMLRSNVLAQPLWQTGKYQWDSYYLGDRIYCTPILNEGDYRHIILPKGIWFSGYKNEVIKSDGETPHFIVNKVNQLPPHYYHANRLIVKQPYTTSASTIPEKLHLELYWENDFIDDTYTLYEDDGYSNDFETDYLETIFTLKGLDKLTLEISHNLKGDFKLQQRSYDLTIYSKQAFKLNSMESHKKSKYDYHQVLLEYLLSTTTLQLEQ